LLQNLVDGEFNGTGGFQFHRHVKNLGDGEILITSPAKVFDEVFKYFDPSRRKAFKAKYGSAKNLDQISFIKIGVKRYGEKIVRGAFIKFQGDEIVTNENVTNL